MRNRFVCLLLALIMALPLVLASCSGETEIKEEAAPVYTLYCITADTTTKESIVEIEYELNRTLYYRIGSIVKLVMVTADEYHDLITSKMLEINDYINGTNESGTNKDKKKHSLVNTAKLSESAKQSGYTKMTGEAILDDLENGIDITLSCPRLDLFLITDYESYKEMAENGDLVALDTVLSNEAKAIKSYVHSSFFKAATVGKKIYGVPCNTIIGEYTYLLFDKEVLDETNIALETLISLDDLSDYLAMVKEIRPDVVPLANISSPSEFSYMFDEGFPMYVDETGYVHSTYEKDTKASEYFAMLARYNALGYFENQDGKNGNDEDVTFGVKFFTGTKEEVETYANEYGYAYNQYSVPVATSENSIDCIYGLSSLCPSSWQTDAMEILTELYVDSKLQNVFLYGIENTNYVLEHNQVKRLNKDYVMSQSHTGNCFIAYTDLDAGDSITKWDDARKQNIDAVESKTLGFTYEPKEFKFGTYINEDGEEEDYIVVEPDFESILWTVAEPYYQKLATGTAVQFDYKTAHAEAYEAALKSIREELLATYTLRLQAKFTSDIPANVTKQYYDQFYARALAEAKDELMDSFGSSSRRRKLRERIAEENPDADDDEIDKLLEAALNNKNLLWDNYRTVVRKESQWQESIEATCQILLDEKIDQQTQAILNSSAYQSQLHNIPNTKEFQKDYAETVELEAEDTAYQNVNAALVDMINAYCKEMIAECEDALTEAIDAFTTEYAAATRKMFEDGVMTEMKKLFKKASESDLVKYQEQWITLITENASESLETLEKNMKRMLKLQYPDLDDEKLNDQFKDVAIPLYEDTLLPLYEKAFNEKKLALYEIGWLSSSELTKFTNTSEEDQTEEPTEEPTTPDEPDVPDNPDEPVEAKPIPGNYSTYYQFVLDKKFRAPYYDQFGSTK